MTGVQTCALPISFLGVIYPLKETVLNTEISHGNRATVLSFHSMIVSIFNYISMLIMGKLVAWFSIETTWMIGGILREYPKVCVNLQTDVR